MVQTAFLDLTRSPITRTAILTMVHLSVFTVNVTKGCDRDLWNDIGITKDTLSFVCVCLMSVFTTMLLCKRYSYSIPIPSVNYILTK